MIIAPEHEEYVEHVSAVSDLLNAGMGLACAVEGKEIPETALKTMQRLLVDVQPYINPIDTAELWAEEGSSFMRCITKHLNFEEIRTIYLSITAGLIGTASEETYRSLKTAEEKVSAALASFANTNTNVPDPSEIHNHIQHTKRAGTTNGVMI